MIVSAIGIPGLSLLELSYMLSKLGVTYGVVKAGQLEKIQGKMENQSLYPVVFHTGSQFIRTYKRFGKSRVVALVLDNPFVLQHELGLTLAGATFTKTTVLYSQFSNKDLKELLLSCKDKTEPLEFERKPFSLVEQTLKEYSASSLSTLQTFLYKIKDVESREVVSRSVKAWMRTDAQFSSLEPKLKKHLSPKSVLALKSIVTSPSMKTFRQAVRKAAQNPGKISKIAKESKLNAFDIKYLLSTTS
jgi:hypothetical protein